MDDNTCGCLVMNIPQPIVVANHLWASIVTESARSIPARAFRSRSEAMSAPPQAASTWYQRLFNRASSALEQRIYHSRVSRTCRGRDHDGNASARAIADDRIFQSVLVHASKSIGCDQSHSRSAYSRLVRDLEPGKMALLRNVEHRRAVKCARPFCRKFRSRPGQSTEQRRIVRFGSAGREMAAGFRWKSCPTSDSTDDVSLYLYCDRGGRQGRQLRIERTGDAIRALGRESWSRIEQPEVARMRHMDEAVFHLFDGPR